MISFVVYAHSSRLANLNQMIRFIEAREKALAGSEILLVVQDGCPTVNSRLFEVHQFNLQMSSYCKPLMCNLGVGQAKHEIVSLLDSDRILPPGYFHRVCSNLQRRQFVTTKFIRKLSGSHTDQQIQQDCFRSYKTEERSELLRPRMKNLFSGNTTFYKADYLPMDERYVGYGFADNDASRTVLEAGGEAIYLPETEIHLHHPVSVFIDGVEIRSFKIVSAINAMIYAEKWKIRDAEINKLCCEVVEELDAYPEEFHESFMKRFRKLRLF